MVKGGLSPGMLGFSQLHGPRGGASPGGTLSKACSGTCASTVPQESQKGGDGQRPAWCELPGGFPASWRDRPRCESRDDLAWRSFCTSGSLSPPGKVLPDSCSEAILLQFPFYSFLFPPQREAVSLKKSG